MSAWDKFLIVMVTAIRNGVFTVIEGKPGNGKTAISSQLAAEIGMDGSTIHATTLTEGYWALPIFSEGKWEMAPIKEWSHLQERAHLILLDEVSEADAIKVMAVIDGHHQLNPGSRFLGAFNSPENNGRREIDPRIAGRALVFRNFMPPAESRRRWKSGEGLLSLGAREIVGKISPTKKAELPEVEDLGAPFGLSPRDMTHIMMCVVSLVGAGVPHDAQINWGMGDFPLLPALLMAKGLSPEAASRLGAEIAVALEASASKATVSDAGIDPDRIASAILSGEASPEDAARLGREHSKK